MSWSFLDFTGLSHFFSKLPEKVVTTDTTQTISGTKSFSSTILGSVSGSAASASKDGSGNVIADTYETKADAATHLSKSDAAGTYLSKTDAASGYVQTAAVDQTVAGTKTFSKPIVGSVTGNAATATTATTAKACTGNAASATKLATARTINGTAFNGTANIITANWGTARNISITDGTNTSTAVSVNGSANVSLNLPATIKATFVGNITGNVTGNCSGSSGSCTGNAATATKLAAKRTIALSGAATGTATGFDGTANIAIPVTSLDASKLTGTASVSTTGNAATATKAVSADSATNASHATSADKATKAEQDGNGNNIVASYVAAGSEGSTTDIGAFMAARPSFIKSFTYNNVWTDAISMRHRNGSGDGSNYGTYIRSSAMNGVSNLLWNHQYAGKWQGERTLVDSVNLAGFTKSAITIYDLVPDGAANHRNFYRGKDITAAFNNGTVSANIANGTFKDIFPGDYIRKSITVPQILKADGTTEYIAQKTYTVNFIIADLDIWLNRGDTATTAHHVAIVPQSVVFNSVMNETNVTDGGYLGSFMNTNVMPAFATGLQNAFGSAHVMQFRFLDTKAVNNDLKSGGIVNFTGATYWGGHDWASHYCHLMTETMVYGAPITASCAADEIMGGMQLAAFRLNNSLVYNRQNYWLGDVVSSAHFALVYGYGYAATYGASTVRGVRPFALLC